MPSRHQMLILSAALGAGLVGCREEVTGSLPPNPAPKPQLPAPAEEPRSTAQGFEGLFSPRPGETWTYLVHRDLPPDSLLNDDDQLRSSDLPGGGYRFTSERKRVCLGPEDIDGEPYPLTVFELSQDGIPTGREYLDIGPDGVIARGWQQASTAGLPLTLLKPGVLLAAPGMTGGQSWESTGTSKDQKIQFRVIERSALTVPAGDYETVRIQMNTGNDSRGVRRTLWFTENVGIVKEETIHYNEHRITVRETITLTGRTFPTEDSDEAPPEPEDAGILPPEVLPPPPDELFDPEALPDEEPGDNSPIVLPEVNSPELEDAEGDEETAPEE